MVKARTFEQVEDVMRDLLCLLLELPSDTPVIRIAYQSDGAPAWKHNDTVLFMRLSESDEEWGHYRDNTYETRSNDVIKESSRTRVWELHLIAYGPDGSQWLNRIKDGIHTQAAKRFYYAMDITAVPSNLAIQRIPELYDGRWWARFDLKLIFYEHYLVEENVKSIEHVNVTIEK